MFRNSSPEFIRQGVEDSMKRLRTDRLDILFVHWPDPLIPFEETGALMGKLVKEGKIRAVGVSNYSPEQITGFKKGG